MKKYIIFFIALLSSLSNYIYCETIGSDTAVSRQEHVTLDGLSNRIAGFAEMSKGFDFIDQNTTCTFDSFFPVEEEINLNEGTLYLNKDLEFKGVLDFINSATIYGNNYNMEFPFSTTTFELPSLETLGQLSLVDTATVPSHVYTYHATIDWSHDDKYLAIGIEDELRVYSFDGISLTQTSSADLLARIYSIKWHPYNYDIVVGKSNGGPTNERLEVRRLNTQSNVLNQIAHISPVMVLRSVEWHPTGDYVAVVGRRSNRELAVYSFSGSSLAWVTDINVPGSGTRYFYEDTILSWRADGQYLVLGCREDATAPELFVHSFDGTSLTLSASAETYEHVRSVDWSPTNSLIVIGLGGIPSPEKMRIYEHNATLNTLIEHPEAREGYVDSCEGVCWSPDGKNIVLGKDFNVGPEVQVFVLHPNYDVQLITGYERINHAIHRVEWSRAKKYIAAYSSDNILWVFDFNTKTPFWFHDTNLIFNSETNIQYKTKFCGNCLIESNNNNLSFKDDYPIEIRPNSSLTIQNSKLFFNNHPYIHIDDTSKLNLKNTILDLPNGMHLLSGPVEVHGKTDLSGTFTFPMNFNDQSDTNLYREVTLTSSWLFRGTSSLNGRGTTLDLLSTGSIIIDYDATLYLANITLKGLNNNQLIFKNDNSQIYISDVNIELDGNITTTIGGIYVNGPSEFMLKNYNWTFDQNSSLTVDGSTLWKNPLNEDQNLGDIKFGSGAQSNYLSLVSSGTIKYIGSCSLINQDLEELRDEIRENSNAIVNIETDFTFSGSITHDLTLKKSKFVQPDERVWVAGDVTIEGQGAVLYFATHKRPIGPQFIIDEGKTLILKNINLTGLASNTFDLRKNSTLIIGANVSWELHENMTLTTGNIILQNQTDENNQDIANLFYVRGMGGKKRLTLNPISKNNSPMLALGQNTLALQDIEFTGLENVNSSISSNDLLIGAVGLAGETAVNIKKSTNMVFAIMGLGNVFRILENNLTLNGQLDFVGLGEDVVHFDFVLRSPVESLYASTQLADGKVPVINFGANFIYLTSLSGVARIIFDDAIARINNAANAFIVTNNSFLGANKLLVSGDPIWDASNDSAKNRFAVEAQEIVAVKSVGDNYEKILPEFGIPIIVDPTHPHRSAEIRSLQTDEDLLETLLEGIRPITALQIENAREERI